MKESSNNISPEGIVAKATSTLHDLVLGVQNLFRQGASSSVPDLADVSGNNHLKTANEIEAEFMRLAKQDLEIAEIEKTGSSDYYILNSTASRTEIFLLNQQLPEYMEENY